MKHGLLLFTGLLLLALGGCDSDSTASCTPECGTDVCGDDGCGGLCGICEDEYACMDGVCVVQECEEGCTEGCPQGCFYMGECDGSDSLSLFPNIRTVGVEVASNAAQGQVYYRAAGQQTWFRAHDPVSAAGMLVTSLFSLSAESTYEVLVVADGERFCSSVTTLPLLAGHETLEILYVDVSNLQEGDGTAGNPFSSISSAVAAASGGTDIVVAPGVYHEEVSVTVSGTEGRYIRFLGDNGAILEGAHPQTQETGLVWTQEGSPVYSAPWDGNPTYLLRDGQRLYHFTSLAGLESGTGDDDVPMDEGYFVEGGLLYVRSLSHPDEYTWQIPDLTVAFALDGAEYIWIEGFTIRYFGEGDYPKGIDIRDSSHIVVKGNTIHDIPSPVWIRRESAENRIEENEIYQTAVHLWPWEAVKGTDHENSAITVAGTRGAIIRGNTIHEIFNGIYTGSFSDDQNRSLAHDVDVYENTLENITDDGLEPEGACVNNRFWGNRISTFHNGISLAPITAGPVWVLRNLFNDYDASAFKFSNDSSGRVLLYHNTCFTDREDQNGLNVSGYFENMVFRNNIIRGTRYAWEISMEVGENDCDYNNYYTTRGAPVVKWDNIRYDTVALWCEATGLECHGHDAEPGLLDPQGGDFSPADQSPNRDRGVRLYGINDAFRGAAPDIGYVEGD